MQLDGLARGRAHRAVAIDARDEVKRAPLRGGEHATGNPHAQHEGERLLELLARALAAQVAVVLQVHAVEFHKLLVVLDDAAGDLVGQPFGERTAQVVARLLDVFVAGQVSHQYTSC